MKISPTFSLFTGTLGARTVEAFYDELEKIAQATDTPPPPKKGEAFKKAVKNVALSALGFAAGDVAARVGHEALKMTMGNKYKNWMPDTKLKIVAPLLGLSSMAIVAATLGWQNEMAKPFAKKAPEAPKKNV